VTRVRLQRGAGLAGLGARPSPAQLSLGGGWIDEGLVFARGALLSHPYEHVAQPVGADGCEEGLSGFLGSGEGSISSGPRELCLTHSLQSRCGRVIDQRADGVSGSALTIRDCSAGQVNGCDQPREPLCSAAW
jgi:hypothetical protein